MSDEREEREPGCAEACAASLRTKYRPSDSVLRDYGHWKAPNEDEARKKFLADHTHHEMFDMSTPTKELKDFGDGIRLYFSLVKHLAFLFGLLAFVPALPLMIFNGLGGWYDRADLERTMLGNFGLLTYDGPSSGLNLTSSSTAKKTASTEGSVTALFMSTVSSAAAKMGGLDKRELLVAMSALDLVGVLAFFLFCMFLIYRVRKATRAADQHATTIANYSVRVERLPPDTSETALREYLTAAVAGTVGSPGKDKYKEGEEQEARRRRSSSKSSKGGEDGQGQQEAGGVAEGAEEAAEEGFGGGGGGFGGAGGEEAGAVKGAAPLPMDMGMGVGYDLGGGGGGATEPGGEVVQVELCRKVDSLIGLVMERDGVLGAGETALAVLQRTAETYPKVAMSLEVDVLEARYKLRFLNDAIRQEQAAADTNQVVTAFVTFSNPDARRRAMDSLPRSAMRRMRMEPEARFNNHGIGEAGSKPVALLVSPAPEPSDVQYENLEYGRAERFARLLATNCAKYVVLLIGFLLVSLAPALRLGLGSATGTGPSRADCDASCSYTDAAGNYVLTDANAALYKSCDPQEGPGTPPNSPLDCESLSICYECYCRAALAAGDYSQLSYCSRFDSVVAVGTVAQALAVGGVVLANMMSQYAIGWLVRQEKHHTRSREAVALARGMFILQFVNTAFSNLVANMYLPGPAKAISGSFLDGYILTGPYADLTPNWYRDVGRPIVISMLLNTLIANGKILAAWLRRRLRMSRRYACLTQRELEEAFAGHEFRLAEKYGHHLYTIFVVMTYSSTMPLLYVIAAVHFASCYWSEKFELLRICKRPLSYSNVLAAYASSTLPFAALWHLAMGAWAFGLFGTPESPVVADGFRRSLERTLRHFDGLMASASTLTPSGVAWRLTQNSSGHLFIAFLFCGAVLFVFFTTSAWIKVSRWLASLLGCIRDTGAAGESSDASPAPEFGTAVRSALLVGPASYAVQRNPAYAFAFAEMAEFEWDSPEDPAAKPPGFPPSDAAMDAAGVSVTSAASGGGGAAGGDKDSLHRASRRQRTAAARLRARRQAAASAAAGWPGDVAGNQVAPEPMRPPPAAAAAARPSVGSYSAPESEIRSSEAGSVSAGSQFAPQPKVV